MDENLHIDKHRTRQAFDRAASSYDAHAAIQRHVADHLVESLDVMNLTPRTIIDIGAGTGYCAGALRRRYTRAQLLLVDFSAAMLEAARAKAPRWRSRQRYICADAEGLPFADASADIVFSSLTFQWCSNLDAVFAECRRVLKPEGLFIFSSLGPDTLHELRAAWRVVDAAPRVNPFIDMHDVGDALVRAGFAGPVLECDVLTATYDDATAVMRDLRGIGAVNTLGGRKRGLSTRNDIRRMSEAYDTFRIDGRIPATYEVVYAHAWRPGADARPQDGSTVATFPFSQLTRRPAQ